MLIHNHPEVERVLNSQDLIKNPKAIVGLLKSFLPNHYLFKGRIKMWPYQIALLYNKKEDKIYYWQPFYFYAFDSKKFELLKPRIIYKDLNGDSQEININSFSYRGFGEMIAFQLFIPLASKEKPYVFKTKFDNYSMRGDFKLKIVILDLIHFYNKVHNNPEALNSLIETAKDIINYALSPDEVGNNNVKQPKIPKVKSKLAN